MWEWWYLSRLESTQDPALRIDLLDKLGNIGSEKAFVTLIEKASEELPELILIRSSFETEIDARDRGGVMFPGMYYGAAINKIRDRIGRTKATALLVKCIKEGSSISARVQYAQQIIFVVTPLELVPSPLREQLSGRVAAGSPQWLILREAMDDAVAVLILGLRSDNVRVRAGAAFALGVCGSECVQAMPVLSTLVDDPHDIVRTAVVEAISRINQDFANKRDGAGIK